MIEEVNKEIDKMIEEATHRQGESTKVNHWDGIITNQAIVSALLDLKQRINDEGNE